MEKKTHRLTGLLYLIVIICAGFSQGYVRETIIVSGDALATATNILEDEELFRLGLSLDLVAFITDAIIAVLLYQMFKPFGKNLALASAALRLIAHPAIGSINLLNHYLAIHVLGGAEYLSSFDQEQLASVSLLLVDAHTNGYLIAGGFFGLHLLLLGLSIHKSNTIPAILGWFLLASSLGYLIETFGNFLVPGYETYTALIVGFSAALGEVSFTFYLLIKGKKL
ncbi:MAG: DUF4386 domain-containing protein [Ekhidna sp.]|nr:DUF4386 domain-containing protein [Ekhidna sp.]